MATLKVNDNRSKNRKYRRNFAVVMALVAVILWAVGAPIWLALPATWISGFFFGAALPPRLQ